MCARLPGRGRYAATNHGQRNRWAGLCSSACGNLCRVWVAYQQRQIRIVDLWVWFAAHELVARRCQVKPGQAVHYREAELTRLVGGTHSMPVSLRRLATAGLLHWEESTLTFPDDRSPNGRFRGTHDDAGTDSQWHRRIPVPRRLLRYLAGGCHKVMVATIVGHLIRCLYYRNGAVPPHGPLQSDLDRRGCSG